MANPTDQRLPDRIRDKFAVRDSGCWEWTASLRNGYGQIWELSPRRLKVAHRMVYELLVGEIPQGLVLDHLCRNRACVNPEHLRPCTHRENLLAPGSESPTAINAAKTQCPDGHPHLSAVGARGWRRCLECHRIRMWQRRNPDGGPVPPRPVAKNG